MPSIQALILRGQLRLLRPFVRNADVEAARAAQDQLGKLGARALERTVSFTYTTFENFDACFASPEGLPENDKRVILYLHGGAYTAGTLDYAMGFGGVLAHRTRCRIFCAAYRLAPEHPYPAGLDDALTAYHFLLHAGYKPENIAFVGESAGGGLIFCLGLLLKQRGEPLPAAFVAMSPWTDLTQTGASYEKNKRKDPTLNRRTLAESAIMYARGDLEIPLVSPAAGDFAGFPPSLLFVGGNEILLDDAKMLHNALLRAGAQSQLVIAPGLWHVYPLFNTPEARASIARIDDFLRQRIGPPPEKNA